MTTIIQNDVPATYLFDFLPKPSVLIEKMSLVHSKKRFRRIRAPHSSYPIEIQESTRMNGGFIKLISNHASINIGQRPAECLARNLAMQARKKPKYMKILHLVDDKIVITLEKCRKKYPEIPSSTFHSVLNTLNKHGLVEKVQLDKKRQAYHKTNVFNLMEARNILSGDCPRPAKSRNAETAPRKKSQSFNPILTMSVYSLLNAFEFFKKTEDRHRQATVILMDLAIEYVLKARLYKADPVKFLEGQLDQLDLFAALREVKKTLKISREDELKLNLIHRTRNYALHEARIPDSPTTKQHMAWTYTFIHEFALENLAVDIDSQIPVDLQAGLLLK